MQQMSNKEQRHVVEQIDILREVPCITVNNFSNLDVIENGS